MLCHGGKIVRGKNDTRIPCFRVFSIIDNNPAFGLELIGWKRTYMGERNPA